MPITKWSNASLDKTIHLGLTIPVILALLALLTPAAIVVALVRSGVTIHQIVTGGAGAPGLAAMAIVGTTVLIMAVMWLIFPWLVLSLLSKIHGELGRIEQNTRHGTVEALKS